MAALSEQKKKKVLVRQGLNSSSQQPEWFGRGCFKNLTLIFKRQSCE